MLEIKDGKIDITKCLNNNNRIINKINNIETKCNYF